METKRKLGKTLLFLALIYTNMHTSVENRVEASSQNNTLTKIKIRKIYLKIRICCWIYTDIALLLKISCLLNLLSCLLQALKWWFTMENLSVGRYSSVVKFALLVVGDIGSNSHQWWLFYCELFFCLISTIYFNQNFTCFLLNISWKTRLFIFTYPCMTRGYTTIQWRTNEINRGHILSKCAILRNIKFVWFWT